MGTSSASNRVYVAGESGEDGRSGIRTEEEEVDAAHAVVDGGNLREDGSGVRRERRAHRDAEQAAATSLIVATCRWNSAGKAATSSRTQHCRSFRHSSDF